MDESQIIQIKPTIYTLEVTTWSNRLILKSLCLECLSKSKTNHVYKDYRNHEQLSSIRVCSGCGAMTQSAAHATFGINVKQLITAIQKGTVLQIPYSSKTAILKAEPIYLRMMKGLTIHGKK